MEDEEVTSRPESPKKKIKSNPVTNSEAEPSNSTDSVNYGENKLM